MRIDDIINKNFSRSFMGYDIEQVDGFLDEMIEALERYESEKREMLNAMEYLMKKLERGQQVHARIDLEISQCLEFDAALWPRRHRSDHRTAVSLRHADRREQVGIVRDDYCALAVP